jgi:Tol biopolymer transport system component
MTASDAPGKFGSRRLDRIIVVGLVASALAVGLGAYGVITAVGGSGPPVLPYRIAYSSVRNGQPNIYILNRDASEDLVPGGGRVNSDPAWSPDGKALAFDRDGAIWVRDDAGTRQVSKIGAASSPRWSPDGQQIAYSNVVGRTPNLGDLWLMNPDGQNQRPILDSSDPNAKPPDCFGVFLGSWYPTGDRLLYRGALSDGRIAICSAKTDGTDVKTIVMESSPTILDLGPALSPDGTKLAFASNRDGSNQIYIANADGSDPRKLLADTGQDGDPAWSPDGLWIAFSSYRDGHSHIYMAHPDGSGLTQLTSGDGDDQNPAWAPN